MLIYNTLNIKRRKRRKERKSCIHTVYNSQRSFCIAQEPRAIIIIETRVDTSQSMKSSIRDRVVKVFKVLYPRALV